MAPDTTPAHLFTPDPGDDPDFPSDEHRRVLARCNPGYGISFSVLHERLAADPYTFEIGLGDEKRISDVLSELVADGDVVQNVHGIWEATPDGWEKVTHHKANEAGAL
jgi:hypothetical protein